MKQQTITINNRTILVLDLPKGINEVRVTTFKNTHTYIYYKSTSIKILDGNWQLLGFISEEVAAKVVPNIGSMSWNEEYKRYDEKPLYPNYIFGIDPFDEALPSLLSALQSKGIMTVNPYGLDEPGCDDICFCKRECAKQQWKTAQSQLWENICLLEKV